MLICRARRGTESLALASSSLCGRRPTTVYDQVLTCGSLSAARTGLCAFRSFQ
jgi:hypothetical protein